MPGRGGYLSPCLLVDAVGELAYGASALHVRAQRYTVLRLMPSMSAATATLPFV